MNKNLFLKPLIDFSDSIIIDATQDKVYSYIDFYTSFQPISQKLIKSDLPINSIIVIYGFKNAFDTLKLFYACLQANYIPFIVEAGNLENNNDLAYAAIFTSVSFTNKEEYEPILTIEDNTAITLYKRKFEILFIGHENDFIIISSSGSTEGTPKKILLGASQTIHNISANQKALGVVKDDVTLIILPISYSYGLIAQFLTHVFSGSKIILGDRTLGILQLPQMLMKYSVTTLFLTPLLSRLVLYYNQNTTTLTNKLRFLTLGGDKPIAKTVAKIEKLFATPIYGTYGLAEAGPRVATNKNISALGAGQSYSIGAANPGVETYVSVCETYSTLQNRNNVGYLSILSPSIYIGYIKGAGIVHPESTSLLKTKDIAYMENNQIYILGRENEYIECKERIIWFHQIAEQLYNDPSVLKVKIEKEANNILNIKIYHRNTASYQDLIDVLKTNFDLMWKRNYMIEFIEFSNNQYK
jgi:acyl-CoA synthetase (AMP-forming)/AMP-acid ligase II